MLRVHAMLAKNLFLSSFCALLEGKDYKEHEKPFLVLPDDFHQQIESVLKPPDELISLVSLVFSFQTLTISFEDRDAEEFVLVLCGYYKLLVNRTLSLQKHKDPWTEEEVAPPYHTQHKVIPAAWSYPVSSGLPGKFPVSGVTSSGRRGTLNGLDSSESVSSTLRSNSSSASPSSSASKHSSSKDQSVAELIEQKNRDFISAISQLVDLTLQPPYQKPPPGFEIPKGSFSKATGMEIDKLDVDANMNKTYMSGTLKRDTNQNLTGNTGSLAGTPTNNKRENRKLVNGDYGFTHATKNDASSVSELKTKRVMNGDHSPKIMSNGDDSDMHEARNDAVIRRVAEMKHLVETAEKYLTDQEDQGANDTDREESMLSDGSGQYGQLKHSDSLLLLIQQGKETDGEGSSPESLRAATQKASVKVDHSGSDTDSLSTPTNSPMRNPKIPERPKDLKTRGSSFGLMSPQEYPNAKSVLSKAASSKSDTLKRLAAKNSMPINFSEGSFVVDADLIDLTMIPPPITPDEEGLRVFPDGPSLPPTPFADRMNLEAELKALEKNFGPLKDLGMWPKNSSIVEKSSVLDTSSDWDDTMSVSSLNTSIVASDFVSSLVQPDIRLAALAHLHSVKDAISDSVDDIDSFIANATIPPPPTNNIPVTTSQLSKLSPVVELTPDDISQFIIHRRRSTSTLTKKTTMTTVWQISL
ncbi:unnamed protein product [Notodromas monacha]|uniref:Uncharacterized protein n=1 Tax=Notodromas monacha TaxID=399045 RepID=A0A7R9BXY6_9CRUS|nr:unnamed protein product [Notodromas monacha]CAG0922678.1 unnamed protein product [Notodromas monacha]